MDTAGDQGVSAPVVQAAHRGRFRREAGQRIEVGSRNMGGCAHVVDTREESRTGNETLPGWQEERCSAGRSFDHLLCDEWLCSTVSSEDITVRRPLLY